MILAGKVSIPVSRIATRFRLYAVGDSHIGNRACSMERLREDVERIRTDRDALWVGMGDLCDYIGPKDKRWDADSVTPDARVNDLADWGMYLAKTARDVFRPIADRCIGLLEGNHEDTYQGRHAQQLHAWLCTELGVRDLGYSCFFDLRFHKKTMARKNTGRAYRVFCHHGAGSAQSPGGKTNRLVKFMQAFDADIYLVGHLHERDVKRSDALGADQGCQNLKARKRLGVFSGTYLRTYSVGHAGYGERRGYAPVPLGCSVIEFQPFGGDWKPREQSVECRVAI